MHSRRLTSLEYAEEAGMIVWGPGRGPRLVGCGGLLLASIVIAIFVYAISGGQCTFFIFP
jgi:hypothetical protein